MVARLFKLIYFLIISSTFVMSCGPNKHNISFIPFLCLLLFEIMFWLFSGRCHFHMLMEDDGIYKK